jgi:hypothetical protein
MIAWCIDILVEVGVGPKVIRLIVNFWEKAQLFCKAGGYFGRPFRAKYGVTQGGPLPTIFNLMVDAVVRVWITGIGGTLDITKVRRLVACFYAADTST